MLLRLLEVKGRVSLTGGFSEGKMQRVSRHLVICGNRKRMKGDCLGLTSKIIPRGSPRPAIIADPESNTPGTPGSGTEVIVLGRVFCPPLRLGMFSKSGLVPEKRCRSCLCGTAASVMNLLKTTV